MNTHSAWGDEIIHTLNRLKDLNDGVLFIGSNYMMTPELIESKDRNNKVILMTDPNDAVTNQVYKDLRKISNQFEGYPVSSIYIKRCHTAIEILQGFIKYETNHGNTLKFTRDAVSAYFKTLIGGFHIGEQDLYRFDKNLLLMGDVSFVQYADQLVTSYPQQLNSKGVLIPNVTFGLDVLNISNVDMDSRTFHADFYYWLRFESGYNVGKSIHLKNMISGDLRDITPEAGLDNELAFKLYKVSGNFSAIASLKDFPIDTQELIIEFEIVNPSDKVRISFDYERFENSRKNISDFDIPEWEIEDYYVTVDNFIASSLYGGPALESKKPQRYKTLDVRLRIQRRLTRSLITIVLPLIMIALASISLLYVNGTSDHHKEASIGLFLGIITYSIAYAAITPKSSVLTLADLLFYITFSLVFIIFMKGILVNSVLLSDRTLQVIHSKSIMIGNLTLALYCFLISLIFFRS